MSDAAPQQHPKAAPSTVTSEPSDHSLLRRLRGGDQDAATQLYFRYAHRILALAKKNRSPDLASRGDAEDIVQSVFRIFFRRATHGHYDVPAGEDLWKLLLVIALNRLRAERVFHRAAKRDVRLTTGGAALEHSPAGRGKADDSASTCLQVVLQEALDRLTPQHRTIVELRIEGYEVAEIARRTERSKRTVERVLQEARQQLRGLLPLQED
jgi:RNA polymerase sigma-70 factor (ECF subfamily)